GALFDYLPDIETPPARRLEWGLRCGVCQDMGRVGFLVTLLVLLASVPPVRQAQGAAALERGAAIIDPLALRELDRGRLGLGRVILPMRSVDLPLANSLLFALPSLAPVR